jgi:Xaa-Pro aminopeptidase
MPHPDHHVTLRPVTLRHIDLPDFGMPEAEPAIPADIYAARLDAAGKAAAARGLDVLLVYGDREHFANLAYLTQYDPRFEEAMLLLTPGRAPRLVVGNEGWGYAALSPVVHDRVLFQEFSLLGQPRGQSAPLEEILTDAGVAEGARVGIAGWKYRDDGQGMARPGWIEAPAYLVDALRALTGPAGAVVNATDIFMNARDGLRVINEADQIAAFEYAACHASMAVRRVLAGLTPGESEHAAARRMRMDGFPTSCHPMLTAGPRASAGVGSPGSRPIARGDYLTTALGLWGNLTARCGFVVADAAELPEPIRDYVDRLVIPYFRAAVAWLETVGIGVTGGALHAAVHAHIGDPFFGVTLNPGHQIHLDEWLHSPVTEGSDIVLRSGMALQVDIIPATGTAYCSTNVEDGIALADAALRAELSARFPAAWARIEARRAFMRDALGIHLAAEVLPLSNTPSYLAPFLLAPEMVLTMAG